MFYDELRKLSYTSLEIEKMFDKLTYYIGIILEIEMIKVNFPENYKDVFIE